MRFVLLATSIYVVYQVGLYLLSRHVPTPLLLSAYLLGVVVSMISVQLGHTLLVGSGFSGMNAIQWKCVAGACVFGLTFGAIATWAAGEGTLRVPIETVVITNVGQVMLVPLVLWVGYRYAGDMFGVHSMNPLRVCGIILITAGVVTMFYGEQILAYAGSRLTSERGVPEGHLVHQIAH